MNELPTLKACSLLVVAAGLLHCGGGATPTGNDPRSAGSAAVPARGERSFCTDLCGLAPSFARPAATATKAPSIHATDTRGAPVDVAASGTPALFAFVSPITAPSFAYAPAVINAANGLGEQRRAGVFLVISADSEEIAESFAKGVPTSGRARVIRDAGERMAKAFGTSQFPETWLVDGRGRIRARWDGERHFDAALLGRVVDAIAAGGDCSVDIDPGGDFAESPPLVRGRDADACRDALPKR